MPKPKQTVAESPASKALEARKRRKLIRESGLTVDKFRVLEFLCDTGEPQTYRDIEAGTGDYSNLTAVLRVDKEGSLSQLQLVREKRKAGVVAYEATPKGRAMCSKLKS